MKWYEKTIKKQGKEITISAVIVLIFGLTTLLWSYVSGQAFHWQSIELIETPSIFSRVFYSALVFISLGAILYALKFYKLLHFIFVDLLGDWQAYKAIKGVIWGGLILLMYFWIVPKVVEVLNAVISFFYNILNLVLYLLPPAGITLILVSIGYLIITDKKLKP